MRNGMTALVTGASGGLGLEVSRLLARDGYDVVLVARNERRLGEVARELEAEDGIVAHVCPTDLAREDAALGVLAYVRERGIAIDVLVNNAGFGDAGPFVEADWGRQRDMLQVNVCALMQLTYCFAGPMVERGRGRILNMSSVAAFSAGPGMSVYYASKAFVLSFSEALSEELRGTGVTVTAVCPGPTGTGFADAAGMGTEATMFRRAADAGTVARDAMRALSAGKALSYQGAYTKLMGLASRLVPRVMARRYAARMNRR